ncbi:2-hydroxyacylsphingosine 1-beta-galactosyltransferase-like [Littorina saxatilis]|uniref:Uncharacterized protein n=1 Tax=Littorina saxatilis TaxID=31220 RepID=A0AAN9BEH3_9CAEN
MKRSLLPTSVILCLVTLYAPSTAAKRIIFMPFPITSTAYIHVEIARAMLDRGHQVWLVVPDIVAQKKVLNIEGMTVIQYHTRYSVEDDIVSEFFLKSFLEYRSLPFADATERILATTHDTLSNKELFEELKAVQADLFVFDDQDCISKMFVVFPYRLGVPFVGTDFQLQPFSRRVPFSPATLPAFMTETSHHLTLKERVQNTLIHLLQLVYTPWQIPDAVARYAPEMPYISLDRLVARAELWLLQIDPIVQFPYPTVPNVKHIGCIPASPAKPLDSKFQSFMDKAKDGAVVVTFGSMVKNLPQNITDKLMTAFLKLRPLKVVVRIDVTSPDPEQILTSS